MSLHLDVLTRKEIAIFLLTTGNWYCHDGDIDYMYVPFKILIQNEFHLAVTKLKFVERYCYTLNEAYKIEMVLRNSNDR